MEHATASQPNLAAQGIGTGSKTLADLLPLAAERYGSAALASFKEGGTWKRTTYAEAGELVRNLSLGMIDLGVQPGDKVSILSNTRPEWTYFDFAILSAGATVVPIYQTNSPEECQYVLENSDAVAVAVEDAEQLAKVEAVRDQLPNLRHIFLMEGEAAGDVITMDELAKRGAARDVAEWEARWRGVSPDDICTIIYTSGTTGPPKGCVISHGNYRAMVDMALSEEVLTANKVIYLFLPLAHSFALLVQLAAIDVGSCLAYWERDPLKIIPNLSEVKPDYFPSVPRIFEKIYTAATTGVEEAGGLKKAIFNWAIKVGHEMREVEARGEQPGFLLKKKYGFAEKKVLSKIQALFGGRLENAITGAAPINPDILRFFHAGGVLVLEGWGMTETSTASCVNTPGNYKFGTVGRPFPGCELKIAEDGEVLVKGPNVFQGYYKNPEATAETLIDGWLHTGDIGEIDADGFLSITGRKKDIIITAGGKNITPSNLEAEIKQNRWVSQCVVIGDRRPFLVALVTLDAEEVVKFAAERGLPEDPVALSSNADLKAEIEAHVEEINKKFARVEQVKKIHILPQDLSQEGGELTPTLKVKRNVVAEKYAAEIEALYAE
jgi:long-chain acyl-CoA synthetase